MVRSMMSFTYLSLSFQGYIQETTTCTLNHVPSKYMDKTIYELLIGHSIQITYKFGIVRKLKVIAFTTSISKRFLLLELVLFSRENLFSKGQVRGRYNLMKLQYYKLPQMSDRLMCHHKQLIIVRGYSTLGRTW